MTTVAGFGKGQFQKAFDYAPGLLIPRRHKSK